MTFHIWPFLMKILVGPRELCHILPNKYWIMDWKDSSFVFIQPFETGVPFHKEGVDMYRKYYFSIFDPFIEITINHNQHNHKNSAGEVWRDKSNLHSAVSLSLTSSHSYFMMFHDLNSRWGVSPCFEYIICSARFDLWRIMQRFWRSRYIHIDLYSYGYVIFTSRIKDDNFGFALICCLVIVRRVHIWSSGFRPSNAFDLIPGS